MLPSLLQHVSSKRTARPACPSLPRAPIPSLAKINFNVRRSKFKVRRFPPLTSSLLLLFTSSCLFIPALACKVPVFRFALERWPADPILLQINAPETDPSVLLLRGLNPAPNLRLLTTRAPGEPNLTLRRPGSPAGSPAWWQAPSSPAAAASLADSPARQRVAQRLLAGESAVWLVVSRGDPVRDRAAADLLARAFLRASRDLSLPTGVIPSDNAAQALAADPSATMDDVLRSPLPLRISFVTETLSVSDPAEETFRSLLLGLSPLPASPGEPLLLPVFGRGRALLPAPLSKLDENAVFRACALLCSACACTVKERNPGVDLPFAVDWDTALRLTTVSVERASLAPEVGVTRPAAAQSNEPQTQNRLLILASLLVFAVAACAAFLRISKN